jgi:hypothetical protein
VSRREQQPEERIEANPFWGPSAPGTHWRGAATASASSTESSAVQGGSDELDSLGSTTLSCTSHIGTEGAVGVDVPQAEMQLWLWHSMS